MRALSTLAVNRKPGEKDDKKESTDIRSQTDNAGNSVI